MIEVGDKVISVAWALCTWSFYSRYCSVLFCFGLPITPEFGVTLESGKPKVGNVSIILGKGKYVQHALCLFHTLPQES